MYTRNNTYGYPSSESVWIDSLSDWPVESKLGYPNELLLYIEPEERLSLLKLDCVRTVIRGPELVAELVI